MATAHTIGNNPFAQSDDYQSLTLLCHKESVAMIEMALEELALSIAAFEKEELEACGPKALIANRGDAAYGDEAPAEHAIWQIDMVFADHEARKEAETRLKRLQQNGATIQEWHWQDLEMRDWVSEIQSQFPPLRVGRFFIHGSHIEAEPLPAYSLEINAGRAFGTGEHATTAGCLQALQWLKQRQLHFRSVMDLGCGTGILALAAKRLWRGARTTGSDMDRVSVTVAQDNARDNTQPNMRLYTARGFTHGGLARAPRYDLLIANILAWPLIHLAGDVAQHVQPGGYIVLSGLLTRQEKDVLLSYQNRGFRLQKRFRRDHWSALVLRKAL